MKKLIISTLVIVLISLQAVAQNIPEKGYYIDLNGNKIECYITNKGWTNSPLDFRYRKSERGAEFTLRPKDVKEFGVGKNLVFVSYHGKLDISSSSSENLSRLKEPEFEDRSIFLRVLVKGENSLFSFVSGGNPQFFTQKGAGQITPLIYKKYKDQNGETKINNEYLTQIEQSFKCSNQNDFDINSIGYLWGDLVDQITTYNDCNGSKSIDFSKRIKAKRDSKKFQIALTSGVNLQSVRLGVPRRDFAVNTDRSANFRVGILVEHFFPNINNKLSIIFEPNYQRFSGNFIKESFPSVDATYNYTAIEFPIGLRSYHYFNPKLAFFFNGLFAFSFASDDSKSNVNNFERPLDDSFNFALGVGLSVKNQITGEFRVYPRKQISVFGFGYSNFSAIIGYKIFK